MAKNQKPTADEETLRTSLAGKQESELIDQIVGMTKQAAYQTELITDLKAELKQKSEKPDISGKIFVLDGAGKKVQYIGKGRHRYRDLLITPEYLIEHPEMVDELMGIKVGFLVK